MLFIVNKNSQIATGEHKIHKANCKMKPKYKNVIELGDFYQAKVAQCEAQKYFANVDGCKYCCSEIHLKK